MVYISYRNHKGGVNNLCVAYDSDSQISASSTKGKYRAIELLDKKIDKAGGYWKTRQK